MYRRGFLKATLSASAVTLALGAGLLVPGRVMAAEWPATAFRADSLEVAIRDLLGSSAYSASAGIVIKMPDAAENGGSVPIAVSVEGLKGVKSISLFAEDNPTPLLASFEMTEHLADYVAARLKLAKTTRVLVIVNAEGGLFSAERSVKVLLGGCGG